MRLAISCACSPTSTGLAPCLCHSQVSKATLSRIEADLKRRSVMGGAAAILGMFAGFGLGPRDAAAQEPKRPLRLTNLRLFDGNRLEMQNGVDIQIAGDRIQALPRRGESSGDAELIDCGGRAVVPGLVDMHAHIILAGINEQTAMFGETTFVHLVASRTASTMLSQGFTTIRDVGGPAFALKLAIDRGIVPGPRIFPSGAALSQTSGHGDFRLLDELPRMPTTPAHRVEREGINIIADGVPEVLRRTREQLMKGASQIKVMAGGGVSSLYDPLDTAQYLEEELRAAVQAAADWGTYVCAHVYTPAGIQRCVKAGVKCIEHGQLADATAVKAMADAGVWWSIQPFLADEDANPKSDPRQRAKQVEVGEGTVRSLELARRHSARLAFGTDILFNPGGVARMGRQLNKFTRFMSPLEALRLATGAAGELLALSGPRAPYEGALGVLRPGAMADLLLVDGSPEKSLDWLENYETTLRIIMKDGRFVKRSMA